MTIDNFPAKLGRVRIGLSVFAAALFSATAIAAPEIQESSTPEPDTETRSIRPPTTLTARPKIQATDVPTVRLASPRVLVLKIGSSYSRLNLSGTHLRRVTQASVVKSDGQVAAGFNVRFASRNRTDTRLLLSLIAGKPAAPGDYSLRLTYELDDPRPQTSPRSRHRSVVRTVMAPMTIRANSMSPRITSTMPESPSFGREYAGITVAVADLPGKEVVSVTRYRHTSSGAYCDFEPHHYSPEETHEATWQGENSLQIRFSPGTLIPRNGRTSCRLRFILRTLNELGEEFYSPVEKFISFQPDRRKAYAVSNTWELSKYLGFEFQPEAVGICSGTSPGTSGAFPVGLLNQSGDIQLRIRSGPIGTNCTWMIFPTGLRSDWEMRMKFEKKEVGSKCGTGSGLADVFDGNRFEFDRGPFLYHSGGTLSFEHNNPNGEKFRYGALLDFKYVNLACAPTLTNDHGVTIRMVSAELYGEGEPNCTWKCGVVD